MAPILNKYCVGCHTVDDPEGGLVLETYAGLIKGGENGAAVEAKDGPASLLVKRLTGVIKPGMPPDDEPKPNGEEIATLIRWIDSGALGPLGALDSRELLWVN